MDPNTALENAREASKKIGEAKTPDEAVSAAVDLMMHFDDLDRWKSNGGFDPADWQPRKNKPASEYAGRRTVSPRGF